MSDQTAVNLLSYDETATPIRLGSTASEHVSKHKFYKTIADDFSVAIKHKEDSDGTIGTKSEIMEIFPENIPNPPEARYSFSILQEWEGYVVSISEEHFTARLIDITKNRTIEDEEADIPFAELEDADRLKILPGAIFRWVIGYRRSPGGTKDRLSRIVFRNLPAWTTKEIQKNRHDAAGWASQLTVD